MKQLIAWNNSPKKIAKKSLNTKLDLNLKSNLKFNLIIFFWWFRRAIFNKLLY